MKRIFNIILVILLLNTLVPYEVFAEGNNDNEEEYEFEELEIDVSKPALGSQNSNGVFLDEKGQVWNWGSGFRTQKGAGINRYNEDYSLIPRKIGELDSIKGLAKNQMAENAFGLIKEDGTLWVISRKDEYSYDGSGVISEESYGINEMRKVPIEGNVEKAVIGDISLALTDDGKVWHWGMIPDVSLSLSYHRDPITPRIKEGLTDIVDIESGLYFATALDKYGNVWSWGSNESGKLGCADKCDDIGGGIFKGSNYPVKTEISNVVDIEVSYRSTIALKDDGTVWGWGSNTHGHLPFDTANNPTPKRIPNLESIVKISASYWHALALDSEGNVWTWGMNSFGRSEGEDQSEPNPQKIKGLPSMIDIHASKKFSFTVDESGQIWAWGSNDVGELGRGYFRESSKDNRGKTPEPIYGVKYNNQAVEKLSGEMAKAKIRQKVIRDIYGDSLFSDPIDTSTGALLSEINLMGFEDPYPFNFSISYNSLGDLEEAGALGRGWRYSYEFDFHRYGSDIIEITFPDGHKEIYMEKEEGIYHSNNEKSYFPIAEEGRSNTSYYLKAKNGDSYFINMNNLSRIDTRDNKVIEFKYRYSVPHEIVMRTPRNTRNNSDSTYIKFDRNGDGSLSRIYDLQDREVLFDYDDDLRLTKITDANGNTVEYVYDDNGRIIEAIDNEGNTFMKNEYDEEGRVVKQYDSLGNFSTLEYTEDEKGKWIKTITTDREGNKRTLIHDNNYNLIEVIDALGNSTKYEYDDSGNQTKIIDAEGNVTTMEYDNKNNLTSMTNAKGQTFEFEYDEYSQLTKTVNPAGQEVTYEYNDAGQLTKIVDSDGNETIYVYSNNLLKEKIEPGDRKTTYEYDGGFISEIVDPEGNKTEFKTDRIGRIIEEKDPEGNITKYTYDNNNNLLNITDPLGQVEKNVYNSHNELIKSTDVSNVEENYEYDLNGNLLSSQRGEQKNQFEYNAEGFLVKGISPMGYSESTTYDAEGRVVKTTDVLGVETTYTYDKLGNLLSETTAGRTTKYSYDSIGNVVSVTDPEGNVTKFKYNELNQKIKEIDPKGNETLFKYDSYGNLSKVTDALGNSISYKYDSYGNLLELEDAKGNVTTFEYDKNHNLIKVVNPLGQANQYTYDKNGNLIQSFDALGNETTRKYDGLGRLIEVTDALGHTRKTEYDERGNIIALYDAKGNKIQEIIYDDYDNPIEVTDALENTVKNTYDKDNNLISVIDELNRLNKIKNDEAGQVVSFVDTNKVESTATYNEFGELNTYADPNKNKTEYLYNKLGQVLRETNATGHSLEYEYNELGFLTKSKNARGQTATYEYDAVGNLIKVQDEDGTIEYSYDENYNLIEVKETVFDKVTTIKREYDALNRVIKYIDEFGNEIGYTYDEVGNLIKITYPDGKEVKYTYDAVGNMKTVEDWNGNITTYHYDENNSLVKTEKSDGSVEERLYDKKGQLIELKNIDKNGKEIKNYTFEYDSVGNVIKENDNTYGYDSLNRIISANNRSYDYDDAGNILDVEKKNIDDTYIQKFTYGADNRIDSFDEIPADYDADGNLLNIPIEREVLTAEYDSRNRLTSLSRNYNSNVEGEEGNIASGIISSYGYNAENRRTSVTENGKITNFVVSPHANLDQVLMETDEEGNPTKYYVYGQGLISKEDSDGKLSVYHYDRRGSTIALTNAAGELTDTYEYDIYGEILSAEGKTDNRFLYNGKYGVQTDDSGLYHMRARYYNPDLKRFINRDVVQGSILEPQTFNRYAYVNGNPISYIDPFGLSREQDGNLLTGVWNFFIGDDLNTLMNPHASGLQRAWAGISLASNFIPGAGPAFKGFKVLAKGINKGIENAVGKYLKASDFAKRGLPNGSNFSAKGIDNRLEQTAFRQLNFEQNIVTIEYKMYKKNPEEFVRQLKGQEEGINKLTAGEIKSNIEKFREFGRPKEADRAIIEYRKNNPTETDGLAALHNPDCVVGGNPTKICGYGDAKVNSSLGTQNRFRQKQIYDAVKDLPSDARVVFKFIIKE